MDNEWAQDDSPAAGGIGAQLKAEREAQGLTIEQVAAGTRIPQRHLHTIEAGGFASLPGRTYATGFARSYAKLLGVDQDYVAAAVLDEIAAHRPEQERAARFEPGDPARIPSAGLSWLALAAVLLLLAGGFFFMRTLFAPTAELPSLLEQVEEDERERALREAGQPGAPVSPGAEAQAGPVVFTARSSVWVRFSDAQGRRLMEGELDEGESFTVPADAAGPQLLTGRPHLLAITIGGRPVPPISRALETVSEVPVSAAALLARAGTGSADAGGPGAAASPTT